MSISDRTRGRLAEAIPADRIREGDSERALHGVDLSFHPAQLPELVVFAESTNDVSAVLRIADEERIPVVPFGAGTSLEGNIIPVAGGISLDLSRLTHTCTVHPHDLSATVSAGVTRLTLDRAAGEHGLTFPVDPGADATLGGMAATNAAGTTTVRYGKMRQQVLALEAVVPGGHVIRTGSRALKTSAGYDITGLLVGSEGTLAVITELTLRLHAVLEHTQTARISFPALEHACEAAAAIVAAGVDVLRVEVLDEWFVDALNRYTGADVPPGAWLFVDSGGTADGVRGELELVRALAEEAGAVDVEIVESADDRRRLWQARHDATHAIANRWPGTKERATDTCVPLSELVSTAAYARAEIDRLGLPAGIIGHAGEGNLHVAMMLTPGDEDQLRRSDELAHNLVAHALARGGTATAEHGIGLGKLDALADEHGDLLPLMRSIKELFDPHGILNPGKVIAAVDGVSG